MDTSLELNHGPSVVLLIVFGDRFATVPGVQVFLKPALAYFIFSTITNQQ